MNVIKMMNKGQGLLNNAGIGQAQLESGVLMAHLLDCNRTYLYVDRDRTLSPSQVHDYIEMVDKRIRGIPLHYIIGYREFMGLNFYIDENVLIPRPDTEVLVEYAINYAKNRGSNSLKILDIGTGSGAIAVSLAKYIDNSLVTAIDIDNSALVVAKKNAIIHGAADRITFIQGDLLSPLIESQGRIKFDILVSNPPYIPTDDIEGLEPQVRDHEPLKALDGGRDGLDFYRRLAKEAIPFLKDGGLWAVEVGYNQANQVAKILKGRGCYNNIDFIKDLSGYDRVVAATLG